MVVFGLYHGLVFLPIVLSLIGPASTEGYRKEENAVVPSGERLHSYRNTEEEEDIAL